LAENHPTIRSPQNTQPEDPGLSEISDAIQENRKARHEVYNPKELHREITRLQKKPVMMVISKKEKNFLNKQTWESRTPCHNNFVSIFI
jgi:hypothetical protein